SIISVVDLTTNMQQQFEATLEHAEVLKPVATKYVKRTLNSQITVPLRAALRDKTLADDLLELLTNAPTVAEIAVVNASNEILADSDSGRIGANAGPYPNFRELVKRPGMLEKAKLLLPDAQDF